jgi:hypothetical protein
MGESRETCLWLLHVTLGSGLFTQHGKKLVYKYSAKRIYGPIIEKSKKHFYGRAAAELSFSDLVFLRTVTAAQRPVRLRAFSDR